MLESYIRVRKEGLRWVKRDVAEGRYPYPPALLRAGEQKARERGTVYRRPPASPRM